MNNPTIIITGANGYLGSYFVNYFSQLNWSVKAFVHSKPTKQLALVEYVNYSLENSLNNSDFEGVDYVIHGAYVRFDKNKNADTINYDGTQRLLSLCESKRIPILYLSSFSAHDKAVSHYGSHKFKCEALFDLTKHSIFKISFIIGKGGILGEMITRMQSSKFFPLVGGNKPLQIIEIDDLCKSIAVVIEKKMSGSFNIGHQEVITMKTFYSILAKELGTEITFIPVPIKLLYVGCILFEKLGITLPVSSESVLGLLKMRGFETLQTQKKLGFSFLNFSDSLKKNNTNY